MVNHDVEQKRRQRTVKPAMQVEEVPDSPLVRSHQLRGNLRIHKLRPLPHQERFFLFIHHLHKILHMHPADLGHKILPPWLKKEKAEII